MIGGCVPKRLQSINAYINTDFVQYANQGYKTTISGHSLGGSIATMACVQNKWISHCEPHNPYLSDGLIDKIVIANGNDQNLKDRLLVQLTSSDFISELTQEQKNKLQAVFSQFDKNNSASQLNNHSDLTLVAKVILGDDSSYKFDTTFMFIVGEKYDQFIKFLKDSFQFIGKAVQCNPDSYSDLNTDICSPCPAGYSCQNIMMGPYLCSKGQFLTKNNVCESCPRGTYQPKVGSNSCEKCPDNYVCDQGSEQPRQCEKGTYQQNNQCYKCKPGTYQDQQGQKSCKYCPTGNKCSSVDQSPIPCPPGTQRNDDDYFQTFEKAQYCFNCPKGTYQTESGRTGCKYCPTGNKCPSIDQPPIPCPPGTYRNDNDYFQTQEKAQFCFNCSKGTYQTESGQTGCKYCPSGSKCPDPTQSPIPCPPGTYRDDNDYFQTQENSQFCFNCPKGMYQDEPGKKGCAYCPKGFTCNDPSKLPVPIQTSALLLSVFKQQQKIF